MSETTAGSIIGTLRLNISDFEAGIVKARGLADGLDGKNVDVKVKVETASAEAKLAAVAASEAKVDQGNTKLAKSGHDAGKGMGALATAIITLGPAIVPLAAGATGLALGFGAMGAAGVLSIVGIAKEMKAGTTLGVAYTGMVGTLKGDLNTLSHTAAAGVLGPFQLSVADLQRKMPALNGIIGEFSVITGKTAGALTTGLITAFIALAPLARDVGVYVLGLSQQFAAMMSGPGVVSFGDYVRSVFPQVMQSVESIVGAVVHLVAALAPLGMGSLGILRTFADLINAIPVNVLSVLATTASSVYIGFKTFGLLSVGIRAVGSALAFMGVSAETAAAGVAAMTVAAGAIGAVIAVATFMYSQHAEAARKDQEAVNTLTDVLIRNGGVIDDNTVKERANALAKDGTLAAAKAMGYSLDQVTLASLGNVAASAQVTAHTNALNNAWNDATGGVKGYDAAGIHAGSNIVKVTQATQDGVKTLGLAKDAYAAYNAATQTAAAGGNAQAAALQAVALRAGTTAGALAAATEGQQKTADAAANAAAKMYVENDAAGILKGSLDRLNGKALSAAQAQNAFDSALTNMGTAVNSAGKKIHFTTSSIHDMSSASVSLRGQLNGQVSNLMAVVEANGGLANSTGKARVQMVTMRKQIIDNAVAHGVDRAAVTAYIDKLLKIPRKVPPTKLDVDKAAAEKKVKDLVAQINAIKQGKKPGIDANSKKGHDAIAALQKQIDALHGKTVVVKAGFSFASAGFPGKVTAPKSAVFKAAGGPVTGPGSGTSDDVPIWGSNGEHMLTTADVAAAGGHAGVMAWRKSLHMAGGGPVGINVGLPSLDAIRKALTIRVPAATPSGGGGGGLSGGTSGANQAMGLRMMLAHGWGMDQWPPLKALWNRESGWNANIKNPGSTAVGIPQDITGNWHGGAAGQIAWGLNYIAGRYGSPAGAWAHSQGTNPHWYGDGGMLMPGGVGMNEAGGKPERVMSGSQTEWFEAGRAAAGGSSQIGPIELGPNTIRALGRELSARPVVLDGAQVTASVGRRLVPR